MQIGFHHAVMYTVIRLTAVGHREGETISMQTTFRFWEGDMKLIKLFCFIIIGILIFINGCSVPKHLKVDTGRHPKYQDKDVRFRTTYYFRVFDYCAQQYVKGNKSGIHPPFAIDSLYRFKMTGKAKALFQDVHFESGTLMASQIDPFGANVAYDEKNRQYYFKSQAQVQKEAAREKQFEELHRLLAEYRALTEELDIEAKKQSGANTTPKDASAQSIDTHAQQIVDAFRGIITQHISEIKGPTLAKISATDSTAPPANTSTITTSEPADSESESLMDDYCRQLQRGFQILGPEGWRNFDQDERLVLAMSASGKPLIATLNELSGRILDSQPVEADILLPLVREDLRITKAETVFSKFSDGKPEEVIEILEQMISALEGGEK